MANWNKLNAEFDQLMSTLTDDEIKQWADQRSANKAIRQEILATQAKFKAIQIRVEQINNILTATIVGTEPCYPELIQAHDLQFGESAWAMAA